MPQGLKALTGAGGGGTCTIARFPEPPGQRQCDRDERRTAIPAKIFVGNLSFRTTEEEIRQHLSGAGNLVSVFMPLDRATGKPRGFAFVEFGSDSEAAEAIRLYNGRELGGRALRLNPADEKPRDQRPRPSRPFMPQQEFAPEPSFFPVEGRFSRPKGSRRGVRGKKRSL